MKIGYARVSTLDQNLSLQRDALAAAGCERIFEDAVTGAAADRPGLDRAVDLLRAGDTLIVWRLDRLGRSLGHLIGFVGELEARQVGFVSLTEHIDTGTPAGRLTFHLFGALAEFERGLVRERTMAGLAAARARGRRGGRPPALDLAKRELCARLYAEGRYPVAELCRLMGISKPTLYAYVKAHGKSREDGRASHQP
ncbi:Resolvase domain protein (plasmid) [Solidesulfovibrio carbinoliphilus subsp. oakridgensis]|uniref:Resolvase domain protein n=1 Tax=Solidesulfovibrio carbinoliphilus subsp. oakridgensis TaxID=694327 RepID=G7QEB7_9BACT|nr:recombinase family protein [Solidesulfovibrio carbinoliphilus]EHJ46011.1 Resolvase domain protein [Solidesulfovibrio carbinoliphilus subsp. oakridgensis]